MVFYLRFNFRFDVECFDFHIADHAEYAKTEIDGQAWCLSPARFFVFSAFTLTLHKMEHVPSP